MLQRTSEEDYYELRLIAGSRLHPSRLSTFFNAAIVLHLAMFGITLFATKVSEYVTNPNWPKVNGTVWIIFAVQFVLTMGFQNRKVAYRYQRTQAVFLSIIGFLMSVSVYLPFFAIWDDSQTSDKIAHMGFISLFAGIALLILSTFRGVMRVRKGEFREGGRLLYNFQNKTGNVKMSLIVSFTVLAGNLARYLSTEGSSDAAWGPLGYLIICVILQCAISLALPEFFLLTYCKLRFKSFQIPAPNEHNIQINEDIENNKVEIETKNIKEKKHKNKKQIKALTMPFQTLKYWAGWDMKGKKASFGALLIVWTELAIIMFILYVLIYLTDAEGRADLAQFHSFIGPAAIIGYLFALAILVPVQLILFLIQLFSRMKTSIKKSGQ